MVLQPCCSFLIKRSKQTYSSKPNNPKAPNSFLYNQLMHRQAVGMEWTAHDKGVVVPQEQLSPSRWCNTPSSKLSHLCFNACQ
uniref:60S ribosomal protein L28 n=1 Tax=Ursus americanus TaxID=9643 RepID=A0A452SS76_URSAM